MDPICALIEHLHAKKWSNAQMCHFGGNPLLRGVLATSPQFRQILVFPDSLDHISRHFDHLHNEHFIVTAVEGKKDTCVIAWINQRVPVDGRLECEDAAAMWQGDSDLCFFDYFMLTHQ